MAKFKKIPQKVNEGKIVYSKDIIDGIVILAVNEVENVELCTSGADSQMKSRAVKVYFNKDGVYVDVSVKVHYLQSISEVAFKIQETVRHNVESMTEYHISGVNVIINGVLFNDKTEKPV